MMTTFAVGDRVAVRPEHDIPELFRPGGQATQGVVHQVYEDGSVFVHVPIGDEDPDVHSQGVPYGADQLIKL
jgi:hypothetical protein